MTIDRIHTGKKRFLDLLLMADEQESMIDRHLERGEGKESAKSLPQAVQFQNKIVPLRPECEIVRNAISTDVINVFRREC